MRTYFKVLGIVAPAVVVPGEGVEGAELVPPNTHLIVRLVPEATDISPVLSQLIIS